MNHKEFQLRLDLVKDLLARFRLEIQEITPVAYDADCPFPYNNFIYKIELTKPLSEDFRPVGFYSSKPQDKQVSSLILRLSNPKAEGLNHVNRVQSEVASMYLARKGVEAYKSELTSVIPVVYAWEPPNDANHGLGWILMDFKPGVGLDEHFASASDEEKATSIEQVANIFTGIQRAPLPSTLSSYGGLTIDEAGEIVSGQMTVLAGGPWNSYATFWKNKLVSQLNGADGSSALRGWKDNGVRERIDRLLATDLDNFLAEAGVETTKRSLVHGDLTLNNILYDVASKRVTGLVDFDFASISHPSQEFFMSLWDLGGNLGACHGPDPTNGRLTEALITGDFEQSTVPESATSLWATAKTWDSALKARGSVRPSQIAGIAALDQLRRLEATLCPFRLAHPMFLKRKTPEQIVEEREAAEKTLVACLESLGF